MKRTYIVITDNSEDYIQDVLLSILLLNEDEELIIFDNHSKDNTVPKIIETMGVLWINEQYKLYINKEHEEYTTVIGKALSIASHEAFLIEEKGRFKLEEMIQDVEN